MRAAVNEDEAAPVSLYVENLDLTRFSGAAYEESLQNHLRIKYQDRPITVVVTVGTAALEFAQRWRSSLWPGVPLVFGLVDAQTAAQFKGVPNTTGQTVKLSLDDMVTVARSVTPDLKSVVIVGDTLARQPLFRQFVPQIPQINPSIEVVDLTGLPMLDLLNRVANLPSSSVILYTSIYSDGAGTYYTPADALAAIAQSANRPIVVTAETFLGRGGVGGFVMRPSCIGAGIAKTALRILHGEKAADIPVEGEGVKAIFDWRQLQRWKVPASSLPAGSEIRFRPLSAWEQYKWQIIGIILIIVTQGLLILGMLAERQRRLRAEVNAREHLSEIAHMNRRTTVGELCASITHELNQPLGSILSNTEAAEMMMDSRTPDLGEVREILADIKRDDRRASEIISRLRNLLKGAVIETEEFDLNEAVDKVFGLLSHQANGANTALSTSFSNQKLKVSGDRVQLEQVILNLVMNALESMEDKRSGGRREIVGRTARLDHRFAEISIADNGPGIDANKLGAVFKPFFTTKKHGMGMGLSISRKIVEAHGGEIWAESRPQGGVVFRIRLPLMQ